MKRFLVSFICCLALFSCDNKKAQVDELASSVAELKQQILQSMAEVSTLELTVNQKMAIIDSLENEGISGNNLAQNRLKLLEINIKLKNSSNDILLWIQQYNGDSAKALKSKEAINYLQAEKQKIILLRQTADKNVTEVQSFLKNYYEN